VTLHPECFRPGAISASQRPALPLRRDGKHGQRRGLFQSQSFDANVPYISHYMKKSFVAGVLR